MIKLFNLKTKSAALTPAQQRDVETLVQAGREIEAVRQIRRWTDTSLQGAVALVAEFRPLQTPYHSGD